ncbi:unnamed protein product [Prorocentrum cordatum]|nr:unnamed protein product [Polarella glacialis]
MAALGSDGGFDVTSSGFSGNPYPDSKNDTKRGVCMAPLGSDGGFDAASSGFSGNPYPDHNNNTKSFFFVEPDSLLDGGLGTGGVTRGVKLSGFGGAEPHEGFSSWLAKEPGEGFMGKGSYPNFTDAPGTYGHEAQIPLPHSFEQTHATQPCPEKVSHKSMPFLFNHYSGIFTNNDNPLPAPTGKYSGLSSTVHKVKTDEPARVGNSLLKFMSEYLPSQSVFAELLKPIPSKEHKTKYSMKLLTFVQSNWCQLKVKMYEAAEDVYLIEFQRRSGDSLAFNSVYRLAEKYLLDHGFPLEGSGSRGGGRGLCRFVPPSVPLQLMEDEEVPWVEPECMLGPVFDLSRSKCARYQAEGATAIAEMAKAAEEKPKQKFPWSEELKDVMYKLLEVQETIVAFPAVKALHSLAKVHPEARKVAAEKRVAAALEHSRSSLVRGEAAQLRELIAAHCG